MKKLENYIKRDNSPVGLDLFLLHYQTTHYSHSLIFKYPKMQFSSVVILSVASIAVAQNSSYVTVSEESTITETISSCEPTVTDCPFKNKSNNSNSTVSTASVTTYEAGAMKAVPAVAALAAGVALLF